MLGGDAIDKHPHVDCGGDDGGSMTSILYKEAETAGCTAGISERCKFESD